jgi:hypothetical protein
MAGIQVYRDGKKTQAEIFYWKTRRKTEEIGKFLLKKQNRSNFFAG